MSNIKTTKIEVDSIQNWRTAKKVGRLVALLGSLVIQHHPRLASKIKLATFEGDEPINPTSMVCVGPFGDVWQQTPAKLLKKYDIIGVTQDGWVEYAPKDGPEAEIDAFQVLPDLCVDGTVPELRGCHWGIKQPDGTYNQLGKVKSWVARLKCDPTDFYFIDEVVFQNTYVLN